MIYSTIKDLFKGICDAIRSKDGTAEVINHQDIPSRIQAIQSGLDTTDATATADDILAEKTAYVNGSKVTGSMTNNGAVAKTLDTTTTSYTVPAGYHDGSGKVQVSTETKTATLTTSSQSITPSIGKVLSEVTVHAIPSQYVDTSDADATAANILAGKTAYVNGVKITGSISSKAAESYTPGTADQTIAAGQYLSGAQTIKGDANLVAENIKSGVPIFGVEGSYTSDATATAEYIVKGKTAYVNGSKITGSIEKVVSKQVSGDGSSFTSDDNFIYSSFVPSSRMYIETTGFTMNLPLTTSNFGDATAADVAAGKTFTSAAGLKVTGTATSGSSGGIQAQHITSVSDTITISGSGTVKVWGYGYYSSGSYSKTTYAFVGDGYYTTSSYNTPSKTNATFSISGGTLSGLPSNIASLDVLVTIGI